MMIIIIICHRYSGCWLSSTKKKKQSANNINCNSLAQGNCQFIGFVAAFVGAIIKYLQRAEP